MFPAPQLSYLAEGLALLIGQYKGKANITALLSAILAEVQLTENALWAVNASQQVSRAFPIVPGNPQGSYYGPPDQALLQMADLVGCPVGNLTCAQLSFLIPIWIQARKSNATSEAILGILATAFPGEGAFSYSEYYPDAYEVVVPNVPDPTLVGPLGHALAIARPPSVYAVLTWGNWPEATFFFGDSSSGTKGSGLKDSVSGDDAYGLLSSVVV